MMKLEEKLNEIFDNCYSEDLSVCPKHKIFQRQKALNLILELEPLIQQGEREKIVGDLDRYIKQVVACERVKDGDVLVDPVALAALDHWWHALKATVGK